MLGMRPRGTKSRWNIVLSGLHTARQIHPWCNFTAEAAQYVLLCVLYSPRKGQ